MSPGSPRRCTSPRRSARVARFSTTTTMGFFFSSRRPHTRLQGAWSSDVCSSDLVQSSCGQCHRDPLTGTPQLNVGRNLLGRYGCVHCHTIKLPDGSALKPPDDPPSLAHIADKTTREWIYAWLKDPQAYAVTATMPNFKLSDPDARDISAFLIANSTPLAGDTAPVTPASKGKDQKAPDPTVGASLYGE